MAVDADVEARSWPLVSAAVPCRMMVIPALKWDPDFIPGELLCACSAGRGVEKRRKKKVIQR